MYIFPKPTVKGIVDNVDILEWGFKIVDGVER
jgi:hypothetical protein